MFKSCGSFDDHELLRSSQTGDVGMNKAIQNVVVLGGGTGTFTVLSGLVKFFDPTNGPITGLEAIVSVADSGGHSGVCRTHYGVLPPGDLLRAMIALSRLPQLWLRLLGFRFKDGPYENANFGNFLVTAQSLISQDSLAAIDVLHQLLQVQGRVIPVSLTPATLRALYADDTVVDGEHEIGVPSESRPPIVRCEIYPPVEANSKALESIRQADLIIIAMGDLYTSIASVLKVDGIAQALADVRVPIVYVLNLATKPETKAYRAMRFVEVIERLMAPAKLSAVIVNTGRPSEELVQRHNQANEPLVIDDLPRGKGGRHLAVRRSLLATYDAVSVPNPTEKTGLDYLRHDPALLAKAILECPALLRAAGLYPSAALTS